MAPEGTTLKNFIEESKTLSPPSNTKKEAKAQKKE